MGRVETGSFMPERDIGKAEGLRAAIFVWRVMSVLANPEKKIKCNNAQVGNCTGSLVSGSLGKGQKVARDKNRDGYFHLDWGIGTAVGFELPLEATVEAVGGRVGRVGLASQFEGRANGTERDLY